MNRAQLMWTVTFGVHVVSATPSAQAQQMWGASNINGNSFIYKIDDSGYGSAPYGQVTETKILQYEWNDLIGSVVDTAFDSQGRMWGASNISGKSYIYMVDSTGYGSAPYGQIAQTKILQYDWTDLTGVLASIAFDADGNMWGASNINGVSYIYNIDDSGYGSAPYGQVSETKILQQNWVDLRGSVADITFDDSGRMWGASNLAGESWIFQIDDSGYGSASYGQISKATKLTYDGFDLAGEVAEIAFDADGQMWGGSNIAGKSWLYHIDTNALPVSYGAATQTRALQYDWVDLNGRLESITFGPSVVDGTIPTPGGGTPGGGPGGGPGAVPEPATWAMLIVGFAGVGASLRRRRTGESDRLRQRT